MRIFFLALFVTLSVFCFPSDTQAQIVSSDGEEAVALDFDANKICDAGLRRCNVLRTQQLAYWGCMRETCENPPTKDPNCKEGHAACKKHYESYSGCTTDLCGKLVMNFDECPVAREPCGTHLTAYWDCVAVECLGQVDAFVEAAEKEEEKMKEAASKPKPKSRDDYFLPPITPERPVYGSLTAQFRCRNISATLICEGSEMLSCRCGDGSFPVLLSEDEKPPSGSDLVVPE